MSNLSTALGSVRGPGYGVAHGLPGRGQNGTVCGNGPPIACVIQLGQVGFETWIGPLNFLGVQGRTATIEAPNRFFRDWVNDRYLELLRQSLSAEVGRVGGRQAYAGTGRQQQSSRGSSGARCRRLRHPRSRPRRATAIRNSIERYTFAEFVVGSGNQFAHAAALAVANQPGEKYNPLFIYGGVGSGQDAPGDRDWASVVATASNAARCCSCRRKSS